MGGKSVSGKKASGGGIARAPEPVCVSDIRAVHPPEPPLGNDNRVVHPLKPVFDHQSRVLILGTMPSVKSREAGFYYMHPQNRFWPVLCAVLGEKVPPDAAGRHALALRHGIALWDVLASCRIEGSLDGSIRDPVPNDLSVILREAPIQAVFTTGGTAARLYRRFQREVAGMDCIALPSTSPANRKYGSDAVLLAAYRAIPVYLSVLP